MDLNRMFATIASRKVISVVFACLIFFTLPITPGFGQVSTRFWSDNSGTFSTEATLLKINTASVTLKKTNRVVIEVPFSRLSKTDLDFVKEEIRQRNGLASKHQPTFSLDQRKLVQSKSSRSQLPQPQVSSRNTINGGSSTSQSTSRFTQSNAQPALKYSPQPDDFELEPLGAAEPVLPDSVTAAIPTKDTVTHPPSDVARLSAPNKPMREFSLGHPGPKKAPIMLKSPSQVAASEKKPKPKSLLEIKSTFKESQPEMASFESSNELRSNPRSNVASSNELRSQPAESERLAPTSNIWKTSESKDTTTLDTETPSNDFSRGAFKTGDDAIVILDNEAIKTPASKITDQKAVSFDEANFNKVPPARSFGGGVDDAENVFATPPNFTPRKSSFDTPANSDFKSGNQSLANLPARYQILARKMASKDPKEVRSALAEVQNSWPSQRYPALVEAVQKCVKAPRTETRVLAIETLALRDREESLSHILRGIEDPAIAVRDATHKLIEGSEDPKVVSVLIKLLESSHRERVAKTLTKLGPRVEAKVVPLASHKSIEVQLTACKLLGSIGTAQGVRALQTVVATSKEARVRLQAANAIDRINRRLESAK